MGLKRWVAGFDLHGDQQDSATVNAFHRFCREFKPAERIAGGDIWDMRPLRGKASAEEKNECLKADFDAGYAFLEAFRPTVLLLGNHDLRLWRTAEKQGGPTSTLAREYVERVDTLAAKQGFGVRPYHKSRGVYSVGKLNFLHGFYAGEDACRKHARIYGPAVFGHIHAADHVVLPSYGGQREAWSSPCLAAHDMEYNEATPSTLRYDCGWMYGLYDENSYHVFTAQVRGGKVAVAEDLKVVAA